MSSVWLVTRSTRAGAGSSGTPPGTSGRKGDPLYRSRRTLHTGASLLTDKQRARLDDVFAEREACQVEVTWGIYQRIVAAYRAPEQEEGRKVMDALIGSITRGFPTALVEIVTLGRTMKQACRRRPRVLRPARHQEWTDRGDQRSTGTSPRTPRSASATSPTTSPDPDLRR